MVWEDGGGNSASYPIGLCQYPSASYHSLDSREASANAILAYHRKVIQHLEGMFHALEKSSGLNGSNELLVIALIFLGKLAVTGLNK